MATSEPQLDVLVLGDHPSTYLAAALISLTSQVRVAHSTLPDKSENNRMVIVNPALFDLHPILAPLRRKIEMTPLYGVQFLSEDPASRSEFRSKSVVSHVTTYKAVRSAMVKLAADHEVQMLTPKRLEIHRLDEKGAELTIGKNKFRALALLLGDEISESHARMLGLPDGWGADIVHRYTYLKLPASKWADMGNRPLIPMSLNLRDMYCWGWLLPGDRTIQIAVEQPVETLDRAKPAELLSTWSDILRRHGILNGKGELPIASAESIDLPLAECLHMKASPTARS